MIRQNSAQVQSGKETSQNIIRNQKINAERLHFGDVKLLEVTLFPDWSAIVTIDGLPTWTENHLFWFKQEQLLQFSFLEIALANFFGNFFTPYIFLY